MVEGVKDREGIILKKICGYSFWLIEWNLYKSYKVYEKIILVKILLVWEVDRERIKWKILLDF